MKSTLLLGMFAACLFPSTIATPSNKHQVSRVNPRALSDAPGGYAPVHATCPTTRPSLRNASSLSPEETSWLEVRRGKTVSALKDFFGHIEIDGFDAVSYIGSSDMPIIAIALSGGGLPAALNGAGAIKAFDSRTPGATSKGQLGGLLQSATYFSALSGGSWLLGSIYVNNFSTVSNLQENLWEFPVPDLLLGPDPSHTDWFWGNISSEVGAKRQAGFTISETDIWGRLQGYFFFNASHGGVDITWSSIAKTQAFKDGDMPLPLVVMNGNNWTTDDPTPSDPIYEVSPWEFGTFDYNIHGFVPLEYLGTRFANGIVPNNETCVRGFDNAGFITGSSSDIWVGTDSSDLVSVMKEQLSSLEGEVKKNIQGIIDAIEEILGTTNTTLAGSTAYEPNPFYQYNADTSPFAQDTRLTVVDGGKNGLNLPFEPLIQRERNVDVIFAIDAIQGDKYRYPNGTYLVSTYERTLLDLADTSFPPIPDVDTLTNLGLAHQPSFFGCDSSNMTTPTPLVVYLPNHAITFESNFEVMEMDFNDTRRDATILNGYNVATQANGTLDSEWTTCVGCAILNRSFNRTGTTVPKACDQCFQRYCWNGTIDDRPATEYNPPGPLLSTTGSNGSTSTTVPNTASRGSAAWSAVAMLGVALFLNRMAC